jgi:hypothetical protein
MKAKNAKLMRNQKLEVTEVYICNKNRKKKKRQRKGGGGSGEMREERDKTERDTWRRLMGSEKGVGEIEEERWKKRERDGDRGVKRLIGT